MALSIVQAVGKRRKPSTGRSNTTNSNGSQPRPNNSSGSGKSKVRGASRRPRGRR